MNSLNSFHSKVTTEHQAKLAYVYLRQSSPGQVLHNTESTVRQYALVDRAVTLGWPKDRVQVIDEDLGRSGASADWRSGFQQLVTEVSLGHVGLVLSLEASRLARNNGDWAQLLNLCSIFGTLIADSEVVYDPRIYHDRLLLGLAGIMSEAELHQIKMRMDAGKRSKAARGELCWVLPAGLERLRSGEVTLHPDEEIQARLRLIFEKFRELGSARAVMRYLHQEGLKVPRRVINGPGPHDIIWALPTSANVRDILQNLAYAGAYVYGRRKVDRTRPRLESPQGRIVRLPIDRWEVCIQDAFPAYITWEEFVSNQKRLAANQNNYRQNRRGAAREGRALLQGIVLCGLCGSHMTLHYEGGRSDHLVNICEAEVRDYGSPRCQQARGLAVDAEIERLVLQAFEPDRVALALGALEQLERKATTLERQWEMRIERARYEAARAQRQYEMCEPENRLVARNLERLWETKLRAVEEVEQEFQAWRRQHGTVLTDEDRQQILALGEDLPKLWSAPTTTNADRKQIIRLIIKDVVVDQKRERGKLWFKINWQTGTTTEHWIKRRTTSYQEQADLEQLQARVRTLNAEGKTDNEIAATLAKEGYRTTKGGEITNLSVCHMRKLWRIRANQQYEDGRNPQRWEDGTYSVQGAAAIIGVKASTVHRWLRGGLLDARQSAKGGAWKIRLTEEQISCLREYAQQPQAKRQRKTLLRQLATGEQSE
ncbi:MAG: recombinase family protein [Acidobacteria bacterium]|nr:recombinase family protein [Acidobacteriota bacterium]